MKSTILLVAALSIGITSTAVAQGRRDRALRFDALDTNRDGVITRAEWRGTPAIFDALDANGDGVLLRAEAIGTRGEAVGAERRSPDDFVSFDVNGDGIVSRQEWSWNVAGFDRLDTNRDGRLTRAEFASAPSTAASTQTPTYRAGYDRGRQEGIQAGKEDKPRGWDLEGQRELETADSGYEPRLGDRADYQAGYRAGFRLGYREGFRAQ